MSFSPLISVCIPAYNRVDGLDRLLASIRQQTFRDYEVVITDDSTTDAVKQFLETHYRDLPIRYFKNEQSLGSPENWNEGIKRAQGEWIKVMHDDDWFADKNALIKFLQNVSSDTPFVFSGYNIVDEKDNVKPVTCGAHILKRIKQDPFCLLATNYIGHPSTTMFRKDTGVLFDKSLKWLVDIDFYIRCLQKADFRYLDEMLINIGKSDTQLTAAFFRQREIEIPEYFHVLEKFGTGMLKNIRVYDAWWRLFRNLGIKEVADIRESGYAGRIPRVSLAMLHWQKILGKRLMQIALISKTVMHIHYCLYAKN